MNKQLKIYGIIALLLALFIFLNYKSDLGIFCTIICILCSLYLMYQAKENEDFIKQIKDRF